MFWMSLDIVRSKKSVVPLEIKPRYHINSTHSLIPILTLLSSDFNPKYSDCEAGVLTTRHKHSGIQAFTYTNTYSSTVSKFLVVGTAGRMGKTI